MKELENTYHMSLHKGASEQVDKDIALFINKYGKDKLKEVGKLHFANYKKINN